MCSFYNYFGIALISLGSCLIGTFETSKTPNEINLIHEQTDIGREGPMSRGKQPRP